MDDESLYRQGMQGDTLALTELVSRYHTPLYQFLCRFTGDTVLANDLAQETFIRLLTYDGEPPTRFKGWAYMIARNLARDHFKSASARYARAFEDDIDDVRDDFHFPAEANGDIGAALAHLSPEQREVIILRFYHDLKLEEIAGIVHAPLGTVKSRLFHALKGLKRFLVGMETVQYDR